ncbi:hypothetical protein [Flagellimonas hadalis]|uniref:Uncharacterized protein n=1 Tax=Flagellimonas hadalis TaxID=2597517 RepID=A0A5N5IUG6_9FLAO|nr:hypothetical protein [Allomuricauda hadalis]KAB5491405.1 hypothetical protein FOT42_000200 [Allomuricauda hadalis]RUA12892.1 MAG: hypothetical protein DSY83_13265 [Flavobacteriia bacterium]
MKHPIKKTFLILVLLNAIIFSCSKDENDALNSLEDGTMAITINGKSHSFDASTTRVVHVSGSGYSLFSIVGVSIGISGTGNNTSISVSVSKNAPIELSDGLTFISPGDDLEVEYESYSLFDDNDGILAYSDDNAVLKITDYNESSGTVSGEFSAKVAEGDKSYDITGKFLNVPIAGS